MLTKNVTTNFLARCKSFIDSTFYMHTHVPHVSLSLSVCVCEKKQRNILNSRKIIIIVRKVLQFNWPWLKMPFGASKSSRNIYFISFQLNIYVYICYMHRHIENGTAGYIAQVQMLITGRRKLFIFLFSMDSWVDLALFVRLCVCKLETW